MLRLPLASSALALFGLFLPPVAGQERPAAPPTAAANLPGGVAAVVNGQPISEAAIQRALKGVPTDKHAEARPDLLDYLIDNVLIDQYLIQYKLEVPSTEVEARLKELKDDLKKQNRSYEKTLEEMLLTEEELKSQITADLRWDKYVTGQATEKNLRELFDKNPDIFDGTTVRAKHILLSPTAGDAQGAQQAVLQLRQMRQQIEEEVAKGTAKLPASADPLAREQAKAKLYDDAFSALAREKSACPTKARGGDLGWFPRAGAMVEPFAKAAFALKPYQMSEVVQTRFGYHLILATDRKAGKETKYDDVKEIARDVYSDQLRELFTAHLRPKAKIVITPVVASK